MGFNEFADLSHEKFKSNYIGFEKSSYEGEDLLNNLVINMSQKIMKSQEDPSSPASVWLLMPLVENSRSKVDLFPTVAAISS